MKILLFLLTIVIVSCSNVNENNLRIAKDIISNPRSVNSICEKYRIKCVDSSAISYGLKFIQNHKPFVLNETDASEIKYQEIDSIENFAVGNFKPKSYPVKSFTINEISFIDSSSNIVILMFKNISGEWEMYSIRVKEKGLIKPSYLVE